MFRNFLTAQWRQLIMANYEIDPSILTPRIPPGTELDLFEGKCYVSLVGFLFANTRIFGAPIYRYGTFEEVNLRFYVLHRLEDGSVRRGVVFISELVPYPIIAWTANRLYGEKYASARLHHRWLIDENELDIEYRWETPGGMNRIQVVAANRPEEMAPGSFDEFIFEHYYGYTRIGEGLSEEYHVLHPRWEVYPVKRYAIECDFERLYGASFAFLAGQEPRSVCLAHGSDVAIRWKRRRIGSAAI